MELEQGFVCSEFMRNVDFTFQLLGSKNDRLAFTRIFKVVCAQPFNLWPPMIFISIVET